MSKMSKPVCAICKIKFTKMEILSKHMISVHKETPHTRMTRLTEAAKVELKKEPIEKPTMNAQQPKIFDCSECGCILKCKTGLEEHIGSEHKVKPTEDITPTLSVNMRSNLKSQILTTKKMKRRRRRMKYKSTTIPTRCGAKMNPQMAM